MKHTIFRQHRTIGVCGLRSKIFRQVVQKDRRLADASQELFVQHDGNRFEQGVRCDLCGAALMILLTAALLLAAGCAQKDQAEDTSAATEPQTALETVADDYEQEIILTLDDEDMTESAAPTTAKQATEPSAQSATTAKADKETQNTTTTATKSAAEQNAATTTATKSAAEQKTAATATKPAAPQNNTTTTAAPGGKTPNAPATTASGTPKTTSAATTTANGTPTTTSAATLPTAVAERGSYDLPAIPLR